MLPQLDFSTIKNELFPVIAVIFSRTNSLAIKVRGLQAFVTLCGGSNDPGSDDGLDGLGPQKKTPSPSALDKYTMQEKIVPLIRAIKTKEPAVMMAALRVLRVVGQVADAEFVAMEILPILWSMSLGPLLNLKQFQAFMELIKHLSSRVEEEQTKKLQELAVGRPGSPAKDDIMSFGPVSGASLSANGTSETDFESLVKGESGAAANPLESGLDSLTSTPAITSPSSASRKSTPTATFSWSTPPAAPAAKPQPSSFRTVTPDLAHIQPMAPTTTQFSQPLQPTPKPTTFSSTPLAPQSTSTTTATSIDWGAAAAATSTSSNISNSPWSSSSPAAQPPSSAFASLSLGQQQQQQRQQSQTQSFSLPPPPGSTSSSTAASGLSSFSLPPPPGAPGRPQGMATTTTSSGSSSGFGGLGAMSNNSLSSLASMGAGAGASASAGSRSGSGMGANTNMNMSMGMGMGMGVGMGMSMATMKGSNAGSGASLNSMMMGMGSQQGQGQSQKTGLDKYESLL